jgi:hypothetical protein
MNSNSSLALATVRAFCRRAIPVVLALLVVFASRQVARPADNALQGLTAVTHELLVNPQPGDWLMRRGNHRAWGYSSLDQIRSAKCGRSEIGMGLEHGTRLPGGGAAGT